MKLFIFRMGGKCWKGGRITVVHDRKDSARKIAERYLPDGFLLFLDEEPEVVEITKGAHHIYS